MDKLRRAWGASGDSRSRKSSKGRSRSGGERSTPNPTCYDVCVLCIELLWAAASNIVEAAR